MKNAIIFILAVILIGAVAAKNEQITNLQNSLDKANETIKSTKFKYETREAIYNYMIKDAELSKCMSDWRKL